MKPERFGRDSTSALRPAGVDAVDGAAPASQHAAAGRWAGLVGLIISIVVFSPQFLIGCLIVDIGASFHFGALELGIVLGVYGATGAVGAWLAGAWIDRIGTRVGLVVASALTCLCALGSAAAQGWFALLAMYALSGLASGMVGPASVRLLLSGVAPTRRAFVFSLRHSAAPLAGILTGLLAAGAQVRFGWRGTFILFAVIATAIVLVALLWGREGAIPARTAQSRPLRSNTVALLIAAALLVGACVSSFSGFVVASAVSIGMSTQSAGVLLATASAAAIVARLASGWAADRRGGGHLIRVAALLVLGAASCVVVALASGPAVFALAVIAVSATAWSSNALYSYAVVSHQPHAPARAMGTVQIGAFAGSAFGPFLFGFAMDHAGTRVAWIILALLLLFAGTVVLLARRTFQTRPSPLAAH